MDGIQSRIADRPVTIDDGEPFPWQPQTAPGVEPTASLEFLRPVGPPPAGNVPVPALLRRLGEQYERPPTVRNRRRETTISLQFLPNGGDCEQPSAKRRRVIEPSHFRDVAKYFSVDAPTRDEQGDEISIELPCLICGSLLEMPEPLMPIHYPDLETVPLVVLPCGHMFCANCVQQHLQYKDVLIEEHRHDRTAWETTCRDCPLCRFPLEYKCCPHDMKLRAYNVKYPREEQLPKTIPEGGKVPETCRACASGWARGEIHDFCRVIFPDVGGEIYIRPDDVGPVQVDEMREHFVSILWDAVQRQAENMLSW